MKNQMKTKTRINQESKEDPFIFWLVFGTFLVTF